MPQVEVEPVHHSEKEVKVVPVDDPCVVSTSCHSVAQDRMSILEGGIPEGSVSDHKC